jgi:hypothetical protein
VFLGTVCAPVALRAQCPDTGTVVFNGVTAVAGKPYQAKAVTTIVTYATDRTKRVQVTEDNLFRDSRGRVRIERFYDGTDHPPKMIAAQIMIYDNCRTNVSLLPVQRTAKISHEMANLKGSNPPFCQEIDLNNPPESGPKGRFENLGHKVIDDIDVLGQRESYYSSIEAKLSGAPPVHVYETWCSKTLDTPISSYLLSDTPKHEISILIGDLKQIESDSSIFEIPEGYTITNLDQSTPTSNSNGGPSGTSAPG